MEVKMNCDVNLSVVVLKITSKVYHTLDDFVGLVCIVAAVIIALECT